MYIGTKYHLWNYINKYADRSVLSNTLYIIFVDKLGYRIFFIAFFFSSFVNSEIHIKITGIQKWPFSANHNILYISYEEYCRGIKLNVCSFTVNKKKIHVIELLSAKLYSSTLIKDFWVYVLFIVQIKVK